MQFQQPSIEEQYQAAVQERNASLPQQYRDRRTFKAVAVALVAGYLFWLNQRFGFTPDVLDSGLLIVTLYYIFFGEYDPVEGNDIMPTPNWRQYVVPRRPFIASTGTLYLTVWIALIAQLFGLLLEATR
jgi:hypothetical protein